MSQLHPVVAEVTARIAARSERTRRAYLDRMAAAASDRPTRTALPCSNLAHGFAACSVEDKLTLRGATKPGVAIVSAYNDLLSAHQPLQEFPAWIKAAVREAGGVAQFAGGVPAMCDGITQGRTGMELSLFSREVIAMATGVALSHEMFDAALLLGVCDKIVPGLLIGALAFGHLPAILVPAGPMASGLPNREKARIRQLYAEGRASREDLLEAEAASYHSPGTCTFYGTANSNQLVVEVMGLHLPGASFVQPGTPLRRALTEHAARRVVELSASDEHTPLAHVIDEKAVVNGVVALLATGGSTNHTLHLPAIAAAAGIQLTWDDFSDLSAVTPLLARVYPNGSADINHFHAAGGVQFLVGELLDAGLLHADVRTVAGPGLDRYRQEPFLDGDRLVWRDGAGRSLDTDVVRGVAEPFAPDGGLRLLAGNLGRAVMKVSAVAAEHRVVVAPARVFTSQEDFTTAFRAGELDRDVVVVLRGQGPRANGMPELHGLTPALGVLMDRGHRVALVTDGRMSGASGKIPAAIQVTPEAAAGGPLAKVRDGDVVRVDAERGTVELLVPDAELARRNVVDGPASDADWVGTGRELFAVLRRGVGPADRGATVFGTLSETDAVDAGDAAPAAPTSEVVVPGVSLMPAQGR
ncbi:6-phosphogluconate dehydratase [Streptoalloteichus tenebrarius]|uniref:Phosphogluconate dehydratase n=1 Tax=Streptoalloteichus tenebrarius (strain ATCC 17920 / DSM 40477 / JCM 4838 / CBS 697.72 / NBRC 16177 / NCIMB 11028 / NRRL B-12390 / A12253. 1 / ISP 5477) TaxID=1933 RepID=A0ABT1HMP2_STRSD|nr:phosphogluconate dehydratase [Streptoalloteichus tenebrarius]MCP2256763.1 6-phosphogluconate dehydratase [Streptoalloteichus tenebrarius]BFF00332.1 phosphogluconate dehydratase [Streptoalloteichus tenebrarius]